MKFFLFLFLIFQIPLFSADFPVLYQGRFRPFDAYAQIQMHSYQAQEKTWKQHFEENAPILALPSTKEWKDLADLEKTGSLATIYSEEQSRSIKNAYLKLKDFYDQSKTIDKVLITDLTKKLNEAYFFHLSGKEFLHSKNYVLYYPTFYQLKAESFYYNFPFILLVLGFYLASFLLFCFNKKTWGIILIIIGFSLHSFLLFLRIFILKRPPVASMSETLIYVPWTILFSSLIFYWKQRKKTILATGAIASLSILSLIEYFSISHDLENVQAVLNSQYWLTIHVLMIVASYGLFILCALFAHLFLFKFFFSSKTAPILSKLILKTMYAGLTLLIPGTLLGGVWAAQSWGRFWDWDPKESWAFISACVYLAFVHAYRYKKIKEFTLAIGSIIGLLSISFTWYGVNYILGTGLHSYGFGNGGEKNYYTFLLCEVFIIFLSLIVKFIGKKEKLV